jgi:Family of unknown function (DUF6252)
MKKNWIDLTVTFVLLSLLTSCKKQNDDSNNYIKGKMNGIAFACTTGISANTPEPGPNGPKDPNLRVIGSWQNGSIKIFIVQESSSIHTGEYIFQADTHRSCTIDSSGKSYYAGPSGGFFMPSVLLGSGKITIQEIRKKSVTGTFEFTSQSNGGVTFTVTEGSFSVSRN